MKILSVKPDHDGAIAYIDDGELLFSLEGEKDSGYRHAGVSADLMARALAMAPDVPDVIAVGGWHKPRGDLYRDLATGYLGLHELRTGDGQFLGKPVQMFSSSHERSHVYMAVAMAPTAPVRECIILVWEGIIGSFYHWQDYGSRITPVNVLTQPGAKYSALFALADPEFPDALEIPRLDYAGKLMALAAFGDATNVNDNGRATVESLLTIPTVFPFNKKGFVGSPLYNCGVNTPPLHNAARYMTDRLFEIFRVAAERLLPKGLPLLISGGCALNCEWNSRWLESGIFSEVFVPPCANDSGSAIGTAADAMDFYGEPCKLHWNVYSGEEFVWDMRPDPSVWKSRRVHFGEIAAEIARGSVLAWIDGRYEIGPRALGHRSLLASPLISDSARILNRIKEREDYRPVAPCCRRDELEAWFDPPIEDPYMLYFSKVRTDRLLGITHVDGTARVQSVSRTATWSLSELLDATHKLTGYGVLCNTSLNFKGRGFINRASDLFRYCRSRGVAEAVVGDRWYRYQQR